MTDINEAEELQEASSFRDPSGFVFHKNGKVYRKVHTSYKEQYDFLMHSGLSDTLQKESLLVKHIEHDLPVPDDQWYKVLEPEQIPFISYPYEWSFGQLRDAALLTLKIQKMALSSQMSLKDASAFNVQFMHGAPIFIDTLSFEKYEENSPWIGYKQFCQHFLAPLSLMAYNDLRLGSLSQIFLDGIPLDFASKLLPRKSQFSLGILAHVHMHAKSQQKHMSEVLQKQKYKITKTELLGILDSLSNTVASLHLPKQKTVWGEYYNDTNYSGEAQKDKHKKINAWISEVSPKTLWDVGANDAFFSRDAAKKGIFTVASDFDPLAVEKSYQSVKKDRLTHLLPLIVDMTNPTPSRGWDNTERKSFFERSHFDLGLCLALVHHLTITNNIPFLYLAKLFSEHVNHLIIEFVVPAEDSNAARLIANREGLLRDYNQASFEAAFATHFNTVRKESVQESERTLYLFKKKGI